MVAFDGSELDGLDDGAGVVDDDDWEPCRHDCDETCYDELDEPDCRHQHCFMCGGCECPGYCDDHQTYNVRPPAETGGLLEGGGVLLALLLLLLMAAGSHQPAAPSPHRYVVPSCVGLAHIPGYERCHR
jgi:hypothetical protein